MAVWKVRACSYLGFCQFNSGIFLCLIWTYSLIVNICTMTEVYTVGWFSDYYLLKVVCSLLYLISISTCTAIYIT